MKDTRLIGVVGSSECDAETKALAYAVGRGIAGAGYGLVCGGRGGVMEAACRGAAEAGGLTVGILPGESAAGANPFVQLKIVTGMGVARNAIIVRSASAVIAVAGGSGTLSEISFCVKLGVPVIGLRSYDVFPEIIQAHTPEEALAEALKRIS
ncbi:MAG: TIGR00725 family protein [Chitinivibrionia bacterium]|nr:TIGR00725 family protein [Chitinivibrionia bacterium]